MAKGKASELDREIDIERATTSQLPSGQVVETWSKIATNRAAAVYPLRGEERFDAAQFVAKQQVDFKIRWSVALSGVNPLDRVVYPPASSPTEDQIYDIMEVSEVGRRQFLRIRAARRAEAAS